MPNDVIQNTFRSMKPDISSRRSESQRESTLSNLNVRDIALSAWAGTGDFDAVSHKAFTNTF